MSASVTVGELNAKLGLDDQMTKGLDRAEKRFKSSAKGMDQDAKLGLDTDTFDKKLTGLKGSMKEGMGSAMEGGQEAITEGLGPIGGVLTGGLAAIGGLAGAAFYKGFTDATERQAGTAKLGAQLGLTPELAGAAGKEAGDIYGQAYGESLPEVNDAIRFAIQNVGGLGSMTKDQFDQMVKDGLNMAHTFDKELGGETGVFAAVGNIIRNGLAPDAKAAFDLLTKGMQGPANKADDLLETFNEYSTSFRELGIDGKTALGILNQGVLGGARSADQVADALKEFGIRGQDGTEATAEGFKDLGITAKDFAERGLPPLKRFNASAEEIGQILAKGGPQAAAMFDLVTDKLSEMNDPVKRQQTAVKLFGTLAEDMGDAWRDIDPSTAVDSLGEIEGAAKRVDDQLSATNDAKVEAFKRQAETGFIDWMSNSVIPFIQNTALPALKSFGDWWTENIGTWDDTAAGFQKISDFVKGAYDWFVQLPDPIKALLVPLSALDPLIGTLQTAWSGLNTAGSWFVDEIIDPTIGFAQTAAGLFGTLWEQIENGTDVIIGVGQTMFGWIGDTIEKGEGLVAWFIDLPTKIQNGVGDLFGFIGGNFKAALNVIAAAWNGLQIPQIGPYTVEAFGKSLDIGPFGPFDLPDLPTFDSGGRVPGALGASQLIQAHGGEIVLPTHRMPVGAALGAVGLGSSIDNSRTYNYSSTISGTSNPTGNARANMRELRRQGFYAGAGR